MGGGWNWGPQHYVLYKEMLMEGTVRSPLLYQCPACGQFVRYTPSAVEGHVSTHETAELEMWWVVRALS